MSIWSSRINIKLNKGKEFFNNNMDKGNTKRANEELDKNTEKKLKTNPMNWDDGYEAYCKETENSQ